MHVNPTVAYFINSKQREIPAQHREGKHTRAAVAALATYTKHPVFG